MNFDQATHIMGKLVGLTNGWTDASVQQYTEEFEKLGYPEALDTVVDQILRSAQDNYRPPLGVILAAYRSEVVRQELHQIQARPELEEGTGGRIPDWREGVEIARKAYYAECARQGRRPNDARFESMLAKAIGRPDSIR